MAGKFMLLKIFHEKFITYYINEKLMGTVVREQGILIVPEDSPSWVGRRKWRQRRPAFWAETPQAGRMESRGQQGVSETVRSGACHCMWLDIGWRR